MIGKLLLLFAILSSSFAATTGANEEASIPAYIWIVIGVLSGIIIGIVIVALLRWYQGVWLCGIGPFKKEVKASKKETAKASIPPPAAAHQTVVHIKDVEAPATPAPSKETVVSESSGEEEGGEVPEEIVVVTEEQKRQPMNALALKKYGKEMVDLIANYWDTTRDRTVLPACKPGFIWDIVPKSPPNQPESWDTIFKDIDPIVLKNNTNWQHPHFYAYFASACSYPSVMGDMLSSGISSISFTWKASPSMTELEMVMMDWLAKAVGLPDFFLNSHPGPGAGMIQSTASDATYIAVLSARSRAITRYQDKTPSPAQAPDDPIQTFRYHDASIITKLVAYTSEQAHTSVDKAIMLAAVKMRKLKSVVGGPYKNYYVEPETLEAAIKEDRARGFIPFIYVATVGTTNTCGVDPVAALGKICQREKLWVHVDAAYGGSFAMLPEYRHLVDGFDYIDSFNFNPHKALLVNFDCAPMWFKDAKESITYFNVQAEYLRHEYHAEATDYRHLEIALGRRFRSLKVWFVVRALGIEKMRETLRQRIRMAEEFADLVSKDPDFEMIVPPHLGLACFRYKGPNEVNIKLVDTINADRRIHLVSTQINDVFFLRLAVCSLDTNSKDIEYTFQVIKELLPKAIRRAKKSSSNKNGK